MQDLIVYIIITVAVAFAIFNIYKKITGKHKPSDSSDNEPCDCSACRECKLYGTCSRNERQRSYEGKSDQKSEKTRNS